ncbi:hypothetical protein A2U01_0061721, partial [Trifolium medium]|nr:hypothetical protein [Trifolium medium]
DQGCSLGEQKQQKFLVVLARREMARNGEESQKPLPDFQDALTERGKAR